MPEYIARRIVPGDASAVHHNNAIHIFRHILHAVRDQHHRNMPLLVDRGDPVKNFVPSPRVQARRRLVQDQHLRLHRQHTRNRHAPLLPAGQLKR